ncbi:iron ABC transporter permease [Polynucleobacter sp. CS-Odin-A6]|uniref:FecCD family ABC transporter permease n=1 Tax=Polynucleobacter sp. CS-Odin-A6 TaxID=2689106 RepID=UPI001C0C0884|nr:iron ABC transporter permease [Polynucleobacter sp. CS-Odin-A6]MBU3621549.1 iron ABC transporter permease [Polynucleobacter sp. CS-Odin-A6]
MVSTSFSMRAYKSLIALLGFAFVIGLVIIVSQFGAVKIGLDDWASLLHGGGNTQSNSSYILWQLRFPRIIFAIGIGATLGLSGALTQSLFRNPLADPGLLGVSAGAACAVAVAIVIFGDVNIEILSHWRLWTTPIFAFVGAVLVCLTLDRVARWITPGSIAGLLLTGIALNAIAAAFIGLCTYLATDEQLRNFTFWTMGSLSGSNWMLVQAVSVLFMLAWWRLRKLVKVMNVFALGESAAVHVGVEISPIRMEVIVWVALLTGFAVAWCGMIGFVGLIAPNFARAWLGGDQRKVIPVSMILGAILLLLADTFARTIAIPAELPVGIFTALLGAPFFIMLLRTSRRQIA